MKIFNVLLPEKWISELKKTARKESAKNDKDISVSSLIRDLLQKHYGFKNEDK